MNNTWHKVIYMAAGAMMATTAQAQEPVSTNMSAQNEGCVVSTVSGASDNQNCSSGFMTTTNNATVSSSDSLTNKSTVSSSDSISNKAPWYKIDGTGRGGKTETTELGNQDAVAVIFPGDAEKSDVVGKQVQKAPFAGTTRILTSGRALLLTKVFESCKGKNGYLSWKQEGASYNVTCNQPNKAGVIFSGQVAERPADPSKMTVIKFRYTKG